MVTHSKYAPEEENRIRLLLFLQMGIWSCQGIMFEGLVMMKVKAFEENMPYAYCLPRTLYRRQNTF